MKAILVVDKMPKRCLDCELIWDEMNNGIVRCSNGRMLDENDIYKEKPSWCRLRPMPIRMSVRDELSDKYGLRDNPYCQGWNDCLEEIEK